MMNFDLILFSFLFKIFNKDKLSDRFLLHVFLKTFFFFWKNFPKLYSLFINFMFFFSINILLAWSSVIGVWRIECFRSVYRPLHYNLCCFSLRSPLCTLFAIVSLRTEFLDDFVVVNYVAVNQSWSSSSSSSSPL